MKEVSPLKAEPVSPVGKSIMRHSKSVCGSALLFLYYFLMIAAFIPDAALSRTEKVQKSALYAMGGVPVNVSAFQATEDQFAKAIGEAEKEIERLESLMSVYRETSPLSRFNRADQSSMMLDADTGKVVEHSLRIHQMTSGAFDITSGTLVKLWKKAGQEKVAPSEEKVTEALKHTGSSLLQLDGEKNVLSKSDPQVRVDLGGIAKGFFADRIAELLKKKGIRRGIVDMGGDIKCFNDLNDEYFKIGVRNPFNKKELIGILRIRNGAVVTSGDYERYFTIDGVRYCHVIDPRTGYPVKGMSSVTVAAENAMDADALATGLFVLGKKEGIDWIKAHDKYEAIFVYPDSGNSEGYEIFVSEGLRDRFEIMKP